MLAFVPQRDVQGGWEYRSYVFRNQEVVDKLYGSDGHEEGQECIDESCLMAGGLPVVGPDLLREQRRFGGLGLHGLGGLCRGRDGSVCWGSGVLLGCHDGCSRGLLRQLVSLLLGIVMVGFGIRG